MTARHPFLIASSLTFTPSSHHSLRRSRAPRLAWFVSRRLRWCSLVGALLLCLGLGQTALAQAPSAPAAASAPKDLDPALCGLSGDRGSARCGQGDRTVLLANDSAQGPDWSANRRRRLLLGFGVSLLGASVILGGFGLGLLADSPALRTSSGCNVMGLSGPCVPSQATTGAILGLGLGALIGGSVALYFGTRPPPVKK